MDTLNVGERNGRYTTCCNCGVVVYRSKAQLARSKSGNHFCSKQCSQGYISKLVKADVNSICEHCSKEFHSSPSTHRRFCSRECWRKGIQSSGPSHYRKFKKKVCDKCGFIPADKCQLDVHHIDCNKENNKKGNLMTLCANCHRLLHHELRQYACAGDKCEML